MKVVKLNRRYKMFNEGYTYAMRWPSYDFLISRKYEEAMGDLYGWHSYAPGRSAWYSGFGSRDRGSGRLTYLIYVRNESMITAALMRVAS